MWSLHRYLGNTRYVRVYKIQIKNNAINIEKKNVQNYNNCD